MNGRKWWITGAGSLHCKIMILMGKTDPGNKSLHKQQSQVSSSGESTPVSSGGLLPHTGDAAR